MSFDKTTSHAPAEQTEEKPRAVDSTTEQGKDSHAVAGSSAAQGSGEQPSATTRKKSTAGEQDTTDSSQYDPATVDCMTEKVSGKQAPAGELLPSNELADSGQLLPSDGVPTSNELAGSHELATPNQRTISDEPATSNELADMEARVEARKQEEAASMKEKPATTVTPDFVAKCARFSEKGDGILHSSLFHGKYAYVPELKSWYAWAGHHWEPTHIHAVEASVEDVGAKYKEVAAHYRHEATLAKEADDKATHDRLSAAADQMDKRANVLNSSRGVNACIKFTLANKTGPLIAKPDIWDTDPFLLGVTNGVVDLRTGEFRDGRPSDYMRRACPVEWAGINAPAPRWEQSLSEIIGAADGVVPYLHKVLGYAITGLSSEPLFLMLYGERGRNGKTVIMETLKKALGPYMGPIKAEMLLDRNIPKDPDSASPTIMNLNGLRIVWASETNENRRFSTSQVKLLSGSDSLTGRYLWDREDSEFRPTHTLFLLTNFLPRAPSHDTAFWERLRLIDFPFRFVDQPKGELDRQRNPKLESELEQELPGILAWLVRGCLLYQKEGLIAPPAVLDRTNEYKNEEDTMQSFADMCLEKSAEDERVSATYIYEIYREWHKKFVNAKSVPSMHVFGRQLGSKIRKDKVGGLTWYFGVRVSDDGERLAPVSNSGGKT